MNDEVLSEGIYKDIYLCSCAALKRVPDKDLTLEWTAMLGNEEVCFDFDDHVFSIDERGIIQGLITCKFRNWTISMTIVTRGDDMTFNGQILKGKAADIENDVALLKLFLL